MPQQILAFSASFSHPFSSVSFSSPLKKYKKLNNNNKFTLYHTASYKSQRWSFANTSITRPIESHSGAQGNILARPTNIFMGPLWGENFLNFSFQNGIFWRTLYFRPTAGPPNVAGPGVAYPPTPPSRWVCPLLLLYTENFYFCSSIVAFCTRALITINP